MQALSLNSILQTFLIGIFIGIIAIAFHYVLYFFGLKSNKSKILTGILFIVISLTVKALDYPVSRLIDYFLTGKIQHNNMDNAFKTFMLLCTSTVITSALSYFYWDELLKKNQYNKTSKLFINIVNVIIHAIFVLIIMATVFKVDISSLLAASGLGAFILGWSSKPTLTEFFAGLSVQLGRKIKRGQFISVDDEYGIVDDFNWRSITITPVSNDGNIIQKEKYILPNTVIHSKAVKIHKEHDQHPIHIENSFFISPYYMSQTVTIIKNTLHEYAKPESIIVSLQTNARRFYYVQYELYVDSISDMLFFNESFTTSVINRLLKANLPIEGSREPIETRDENHDLRTKYLPSKPEQECIRQAIADNQILCQLDSADIEHIIENSEMEFYVEKEFIIHERVKDNHELILIITGSATCFEHDHTDKRVKVCDFNEKSVFGIQAFLLDTPRRISVQAAEQSWCLKISRETMKNIFESNNAFIHSLTQALEERKLEDSKIIDSFIEENTTPIESTQEMLIRKIKFLFKM